MLFGIYTMLIGFRQVKIEVEKTIINQVSIAKIGKMNGKRFLKKWNEINVNRKSNAQSKSKTRRAIALKTGEGEMRQNFNFFLFLKNKWGTVIKEEDVLKKWKVIVRGSELLKRQSFNQKSNKIVMKLFFVNRDTWEVTLRL